METKTKSQCSHQRAKLVLSMLLALSLTACGGDDGQDGQDGAQGPSGVQGPTGGTVVVSDDATDLNLTITSAAQSADTGLSIDFNIKDQDGYGYVGLQSARFTIAQLVPVGADGPQEPSRWQSYINKTESKPDLAAGIGTGTEDKIQATSESCSSSGRDCADTLINHGDGNYSYTYITDLTAVGQPLTVTYNAELTHRVAIQLDGELKANATYDWQPSSGATDVQSRVIVKTDSCNSCHNDLAMHGGGRIETSYCVTCHNPGSGDANSGNTVDFKVLVHKLHRSSDLPSVKAGNEYAIWGYRNSKHDYSDVIFPQDIRNCQTCHDETDETTPDAGNYFARPSIAACGSCHDDVDFATGIDGGHPGGIMTDSSECTTCHAQDRIAGSVQQSHSLSGKIEAKKAFAIKVDPAKDIKLTVNPLDSTKTDVEVTINLVNPLDNTPYTLAPDKLDFIADGKLMLNWDKDTYQFSYNTIIFFGDYYGNKPPLVASDDANGRYTYQKTLAFDMNDGGSLVVASNIRLCADLKSQQLANCSDDGVEEEAAEAMIVSFSPAAADADYQLPTPAVNFDKCQNCHENLQAHAGYNYGVNDYQQCINCHNSNQTPYYPRSADFKFIVHAKHAGTFVKPAKDENGDYITDSLGNLAYDEPHEIRFPGNIGDCATCHDDASKLLPLREWSKGPRVDGAQISDFTGRLSPIAATCGSCHDSDEAKQHFRNEGAIVDRSLAVDNPPVEACLVCHGPGRDYDIAEVHPVSK